MSRENILDPVLLPVEGIQEDLGTYSKVTQPSITCSKQWWKHQKNKWNLSKVKNKAIYVVLVFLLSTLNK